MTSYLRKLPSNSLKIRTGFIYKDLFMKIYRMMQICITPNMIGLTQRKSVAGKKAERVRNMMLAKHGKNRSKRSFVNASMVNIRYMAYMVYHIDK